MRIVSLLSMWVRLIVDNFRVYDEMNNSASRPRATSRETIGRGLYAGPGP